MSGELHAAIREFQRRPAQPGTAPKAGAVTRAYSHIEPEELHWLWPDRIPLGKLTLLAGDPGLEKSLLTLDIAARVSTGRPFADGGQCERGTVVVVSAEDDSADTIRPRLDAAGADVSRIHSLDAVRIITADGKSVESALNLERDLEALNGLLEKLADVRLIVVDPISVYIGGTDCHKNAEVRGLLSPLATLAAKHRVAILAVTHLRKGSAERAIYRAIGSLAFTAAARSVWAVCKAQDKPLGGANDDAIARGEGEADDGRRLFLPIKQNLSRDTGGLSFRVAEDFDGQPVIAWGGAVRADADALLAGDLKGGRDAERREAEEWLEDFLSEGPQLASEVITTSRRVGITGATLYRAAMSVGVGKKKTWWTRRWLGMVTQRFRFQRFRFYTYACGIFEYPVENTRG